MKVSELINELNLTLQCYGDIRVMLYYEADRITTTLEADSLKLQRLEVDSTLKPELKIIADRIEPELLIAV